MSGRTVASSYASDRAAAIDPESGPFSASRRRPARVDHFQTQSRRLCIPTRRIPWQFVNRLQCQQNDYRDSGSGPWHFGELGATPRSLAITGRDCLFKWVCDRMFWFMIYSFWQRHYWIWFCSHRHLWLKVQISQPIQIRMNC